VPCILDDFLTSLVPHNLRSRPSGYPAGEANLVTFHTGEVGSHLEKSGSQGGLFRIAALAEEGVKVQPQF
jgi:hypothetical protein